MLFQDTYCVCLWWILFNLYESRRNFPWFSLLEFFQDMKLKVETSVGILSKKECHCHIENLKMTLVVRTRHFVCRCNYSRYLFHISTGHSFWNWRNIFSIKPKCDGWMLWIDYYLVHKIVSTGLTTYKMCTSNVK